ncbi:MAG TPA: cupredoxin family copper-binding protein [Candidatus Dormibacteraeota bacterium]|jgi:plastocyanin
MRFPARRSALLASTLATGIGLAGCGGTSAATAPGAGAGGSAASNSTSTMSMPAAATSAAPAAPVAADHVAIAAFAFGPATVMVKPGTTVTWTQQDEDQHTVTADDGSFASSPLVTGGTYTHTFTAPGTYHYHCAIHPFMHGTVIVTNG